MQIHELAKKAGIAPHTIRYYEKEGLLDDRFIQRGQNNYRYYTHEALDRLAMIKQGQSAGFTLSEIRILIQAWDADELTSEKQIDYLEEKLAQLKQKIAELSQIEQYIETKLGRLYHETQVKEDVIAR